MARIRSVHPSLFTDEAWVSCSPLARILYIGLWTDADDQGLFEWKPLQIKMRLLPGDAAQAGGLLEELAGVDLIKCFDRGGRQFGAIKDFRKYQRPQKPNAVHDLPEGLREYVGMEDDDDPTDSLRKRLCDAQDSQCFYCATEITHYSKRGTSCEIDHKVPKAKGGSDDESNLVAACRACNRGKCARSEDDWRAILVARAAKRPVANANTIVAPQMEDGGEDVEKKEEAKASLSPTPTKAPYPEDFETVWKLYPHHPRRSSKPDSLAQWRKLSAEARLTLPAACARYRRLGAEPKGECGAPAMERWLKRGLHLNWTDDGEPVAAEGPADAAVVARRLRHYRDTGAWEPTWGDRPTNDTGREQAA